MFELIKEFKKRSFKGESIYWDFDENCVITNDLDFIKQYEYSLNLCKEIDCILEKEEQMYNNKEGINWKEWNNLKVVNDIMRGYCSEVEDYYIHSEDYYNCMDESKRFKKEIEKLKKWLKLKKD